MKNTNKNAAGEINLKVLVSGLQENQILDHDEMRHIRGGEGEGSGHEPIILPPKP